MNKFKPNKKKICAMCQKSGGDRPLYGVMPDRVICEQCWQEQPLAGEAVLTGNLPVVELTGPAVIAAKKRSK